MWTSPSPRVVRRRDLATWQDLNHPLKIEKPYLSSSIILGILTLLPLPLWATASKSSATLQPSNHRYLMASYWLGPSTTTGAAVIASRDSILFTGFSPLLLHSGHFRSPVTHLLLIRSPRSNPHTTTNSLRPPSILLVAAIAAGDVPSRQHFLTIRPFSSRSLAEHCQPSIQAHSSLDGLPIAPSPIDSCHWNHYQWLHLPLR